MSKEIKELDLIIIGGGPAGMEAAYVASQRGHEVILCEKESELGGLLRLACVPIAKQDLSKVIKFMITRLKKTDVDIRLNCEITSEMLENEFKDYTDEDLYDPTLSLAKKIYAHAKFIHPYKLLMSEQEKEEWISKVKNQDLADIPNDLLQHYQIKPGYKIHKIIYWKLENARCLTIPKNSNFFSSHFYIYETIWQYKLYFSDMLNYEKKKYLLAFIKYCDKNKKTILKEQQNILKGKYQGKLTINKVVMYYINTLYKYPLEDKHNKIIVEYYNNYLKTKD